MTDRQMERQTNGFSALYINVPIATLMFHLKIINNFQAPNMESVDRKKINASLWLCYIKKKNMTIIMKIKGTKRL